MMKQLKCISDLHEWLYADFTEVVYSDDSIENVVLYRTCKNCGKKEIMPKTVQTKWINWNEMAKSA